MRLKKIKMSNLALMAIVSYLDIDEVLPDGSRIYGFSFDDESIDIKIMSPEFETVKDEKDIPVIDLHTDNVQIESLIELLSESKKKTDKIRYENLHETVNQR